MIPQVVRSPACRGEYLSARGNVTAPKELVGIPEHGITHYCRLEAPDCVLRADQYMRAGYANHRIKLRNQFLDAIVRTLSLLIIQNRGLRLHQMIDLRLPLRGWMLLG